MELAQSKYKVITYIQNVESGYYEKQPERVQFLKIPFELKIQPTQEERIKSNGAKEVLVSRIVQGKYKFITGMIPTSYNGYYIANDYEKRGGRKILSLIIVWISDNASHLVLYYFNGFYVHNPNERRVAVNRFIEQKKREIESPFAQSNRRSNPTIQQQR